MTTTPGDDRPPEDPSRQQPPPPPEQPGYWEQQSQPDQPGIPYPQQPYGGGQPSSGQYGGYPQPPVQYAPDHPRATTSLILGILGLVLCQLVAPFAWRIGKRTVDEIDASQGRMGGRGSAQAGYVMGIIGTALLAFGLIAIVLWVVVAVALFSSSSTTG